MEMIDAVDNDFVDSFGPGEKDQLGELEAIIQRGITTFLEVGRALQEIRDRRLYRETHSSFEHYAREKFGYERAHTHRLIASVNVAQNLYPSGDVLGLATEYSLRPLAKLIPQEQIEVWRRATELAGEGPPSARLVRQAIRDLATVRQCEASGSDVTEATMIQGLENLASDASVMPEERPGSAPAAPNGSRNLPGEDSHHGEEDFQLADGSVVSGWEWTAGPVPADRIRMELGAIQAGSQSLRETVLAQTVLLKVAAQINWLMTDIALEPSPGRYPTDEAVLHEPATALAESLEKAACLLSRMLRSKAGQPDHMEATH